MRRPRISVACRIWLEKLCQTVSYRHPQGSRSASKVLFHSSVIFQESKSPWKVHWPCLSHVATPLRGRAGHQIYSPTNAAPPVGSDPKEKLSSVEEVWIRKKPTPAWKVTLRWMNRLNNMYIKFNLGPIYTHSVPDVAIGWWQWQVFSLLIFLLLLTFSS